MEDFRWKQSNNINVDLFWNNKKSQIHCFSTKFLMKTANAQRVRAIRLAQMRQQLQPPTQLHWFLCFLSFKYEKEICPFHIFKILPHIDGCNKYSEKWLSLPEHVILIWMVLLSCTAALWLHQRGAKEEGGGGLRDGKNVVIVLSRYVCLWQTERMGERGDQILLQVLYKQHNSASSSPLPPSCMCECLLTAALHFCLLLLN